MKAIALLVAAAALIVALVAQEPPECSNGRWETVQAADGPTYVPDAAEWVCG